MPRVACFVVDAGWTAKNTTKLLEALASSIFEVSLRQDFDGTPPDLGALLTTRIESIRPALSLLESCPVPVVVVMPCTPADADAHPTRVSAVVGLDRSPCDIQTALHAAAQSAGHGHGPLRTRPGRFERLVTSLTRTERLIFELLAKYFGEWVQSQQIIEEAIITHHQDTTLVRVHMHRLRRKIAAMALAIESRRRLGYRLVSLVGDMDVGEETTSCH